MARRKSQSLGTLAGLTGAEVTSAVLVRWWRELNAQCFGGKLPVVACEVARCASPRSLSETARRGETWVVRIAPHVAAYGELYAVAQLLHEAVHVYCARVLGEDERSYDGHGPAFTREANRIASLLGLSVRTHEKGGKGFLTPGAWPGLWLERPASPLASQKPRAESESLAVEVGLLRARVVELERVNAELQRGGGGGVELAEVRRRLAAEVDTRQRELADAKNASTSGGKVAAARALLKQAETALAIVDDVTRR